MRKIEPKEMVRIQYDILVHFDEFCKENNLNYSLNYGTLIGAIRHKGIIPWDDDIDVAMPRTDFEKLFATYDNDKNSIYKVLNHKTHPEIDTKIGYMIDYRTIITTTIDESYLDWKGLHIDIYPIDILPDNKLYRKLFILKTRLYANLIRAKTLRKRVPAGVRSKKKQVIVNILKTCVFWLDLDKTIDKLINYSSKYSDRWSNIQKTDMATILCEFDPPKLFPAQLFLDYKRWPFEDGEYSIISGFDQYLKIWYGDYLTLPPVEERVPKRSSITEYYWKDQFMDE